MDMATNLNTKNNPAKRKSDNSVVYKVTLALVLLCIGILALRKVHDYYSTVGGQQVLDSLRGIIALVGFGLSAVGIALLCVWKNPIHRTVTPWLVLVFAMAGMTGLSMLAEYTYGFSLLYFLWALVLVQYIIYLLYRWEFFLLSLPTAAAGFLFYQMKAGFSLSLRNMLPLVLTIVSLVCLVLVSVSASKNKGCVVMGSARVRLFSKSYNPFLHYVVAALWAICIPASFLLGGLFAFYCMFAAIAVEFIAAVYYTFQLN